MLFVILILLGGRRVFHPLERLVDSFQYALLIVFVDIGHIADGTLGVVQIALKPIPCFDLVLLLGILIGKFLGLGDHSLDILVGKTSLFACDSERLRLAGSLVGSRNTENTVGIHIERYLDLGDATRSGRNSAELKLTQETIRLGHGTLTFKNLDVDSRLIIGVGREHLALLHRDGCASLDDGSHNSTGSLDTQRKRGNVEKQHILGSLGRVARKDATLNGGAKRNGLQKRKKCKVQKY